MTFVVEATYLNGVLKPKEPLALSEGAEVRLTVTPTEEANDPLEAVIGIGDGRPDGAENHDKYIYGKNPAMIFVDTWAWVALAYKRDQHHEARPRSTVACEALAASMSRLDFVLSELIAHLYTTLTADQAGAFINSLLAAADAGTSQLVHVSAQQFRQAWQMRQKYHDKPDISFVDFTSMVVMRELGTTDVFSGDAHFQQVGLGFRLVC